ncbi:MAG: transketolase, partial [Bacillota bacterium]|nr:transketolase [Bacillota bacterium]
PGLPLGAAPIAYELWANHMIHNPKNPKWINRDRFILSAGHGSAMLYSLLHLFGYDLPISELKRFRQLDSLTPGHPEYGHTTGVEATTGPLGAGLGMAVGMAIAEKHLAKRYNRDGYNIFDHYTYALCGDGCLMEGISYEVLSLAGTLGLDKLIVLYDSNSITIEGGTDLAFTEDVTKRFEAMGFQTLEVSDGNDLAAVGRAIEEAKSDKNRPSFIKITTVIGYGVPAKAGKASAHGEPLGEENVKILRENLGWKHDEPFFVPEEVYQYYNELTAKGAASEDAWNKMFAAYSDAYPELSAELEACLNGSNAAKLENDENYWQRGTKANATRNISGSIINYVKDVVTELIGGSADLGPSNKTVMQAEAALSKDTPEGRNIHFGVRELGMTAVANGILLHGGLRTYIATFLVFADYMKPMLRLASLMKIPQIAVLSHDSIGVGEDGPTHQPIEQLTMLRGMPNMNVWRPADEMETRVAWFSALTQKETPSCIALSRQNLPVIENSSKEALKGAYIVHKEKGSAPDIILMASGSELSIAIDAAKVLEDEGKAVRVVSVPCLDVFEKQSEEYKESILPSNCRKRVAVEAASSVSWGKYVGLDGAYVTMDGFGESAPAGELFNRFGFTAQNVAAVARSLFIDA